MNTPRILPALLIAGVGVLLGTGVRAADPKPDTRPHSGVAGFQAGDFQTARDGKREFAPRGSDSGAPGETTSVKRAPIAASSLVWNISAAE